MKKQKLSDDLVKKTVEALDEAEDAILGVKTGLTAGGVKLGDGTDCPAGGCPQPPYGVGTD